MGLKPLSLPAQAWDELLFVPWLQGMASNGLTPPKTRWNHEGTTFPLVSHPGSRHSKPPPDSRAMEALPLKLAPQSIRLWLELYLSIRYSGKSIWGSRLPCPLLHQAEAWETLRQHELEAWNQRLLKGVSVYEQKAFLLGVTGEYPILLLWQKPHPWELLDVQAQGYRVINLYTCYQDFTNDGNTPRWDPGTFVLHDLKHAYEFFEDPKRYLGQILLYRLVAQLRTHKDFLARLDSHGDWAKAFYYLISDMNTHPIHWLKTAEAIFKIYGEKACWDQLWHGEAPKLGWLPRLCEWAFRINELQPSELADFWDALTDTTNWEKTPLSQRLKTGRASHPRPVATAPAPESGSAANAR